MYGPIEVIDGATPEKIYYWGSSLAFGFVLVVLGIVAMVRSFIANVASVVFFGWLLMFASIIEFADAFIQGESPGFFVRLLVAIVFGTTGALIVFKPVISAETVTVVMSAVFLFAGLYQFFASMWSNLPGWGWEATNGIISAIMGMLSSRNGRSRGSGWWVSSLGSI